MKTPNGDFMESCIFWIYGKTEDETIKKVKKYGIKKKYYQVVEVIEKEEDATT